MLTLSNLLTSLMHSIPRNWMKEVKLAEEVHRKPRFFKALRRTFVWSFAYYGGWQFFLAVVLRYVFLLCPRIILICSVTLVLLSRVLQPYILGLLIWHFDLRATSTATEAYTYASAVVLISLFSAVIVHHSTLGLMEVGMRMRVACSSLMYRKVIEIIFYNFTYNKYYY